jgi:hypothetical protein
MGTVVESNEAICARGTNLHHGGEIAMGFAQNVMQCECAYQTNKRKRKADTAFGEDYDYLYGIITTATELRKSDGGHCWVTEG